MTFVQLFVALTLAVPVLTAAQSAANKSSPAAKAKLTAIWEPVNVKEDLELVSVHFTSADEGWIAGGRPGGSGGIILHTSDGGATWETQLGDPASADAIYKELRFLDANTGFALQAGAGGHRLFRTTDGKSWAPAGTVAGHYSDYQFVSPEIGFVSEGARIVRTSDGGKKWGAVHECRAKVEVQGLTREVQCDVEKLFFVDATTGYAVTRTLGGDAGIALLKTTDGGMKWSPSVVLPGENAKEGALHFFDQNSGLVRVVGGKVFRTSDGGQTWAQVPGEIGGNPDLEFADGQVGWMARYQLLLYTRDGGKTWISSALTFPAMVNASSLPARDRGYVVGDHGMVYRYRIVPIDYTAKGMLTAPVIAPRAP